jgi:hypothetical protein
MDYAPTYADGLRDGQLKAIEDMQAKQNARLDDHSKRITAVERVAWILVGVVGLIQFSPAVRGFLGI